MLKQYAQVGKENNNKLVILAFPTNDFHQEPGTNQQIKNKVIQLLATAGTDEQEEEQDFGFYNTYKSNFVLFQPSSLRQNPIYQLLKAHMPQYKVKHNFFKYVIGKDGIPLSFHTKKESLLDMEDGIRQLIHDNDE